ncbi:glycoside hydrolase family 32 protein [Polaribacter sp.]|nr:glycoside hydrolase family 32 protein [Polaribacter sp.]MDA9245648.1 glycoside hydrolase family 32 protein [Polaribacter sp.]MDA9363663.1 glycoside hydrolase family 32 protein [Polaribacter sp.]MDC1354808.1 glycoside hydrolase family 32 protein [Polaribacter sp.]MDC1461012.1 glycoside hydrolase family 32 protein [Polaribacter sp.]
MKNKKAYYGIHLLLIAGVFVFSVGCKNNMEKKGSKEIAANEISAEEQLYRPNFHFTPKANWMNDPNGMFYLNGTYHLYYQYYPDGNVWGPMHWGHATSTNMIAWEEQPIAIYPDDLGLIFSGSAVVDVNNTSGFGKDGIVPIVAMYTYHNMKGEQAGDLDFQTQAIAYSLDEGMTWVKYDKNPVIPNSGIKDFRDPKVIWDVDHSKWIMTLAAGDKVLFYSSLNLREWILESSFGAAFGQHDGMWECPDLFPIKVSGQDETKWVLLVSINPAAPNGGSGTQYFVGDFDGQKFTLDTDFKQQLQQDSAVWLDYGRDNYAGVTWSNIPKKDGRKLFIGWMSNWEYARDVPTETWRSAMTIPRELKLKKNEKEFVLSSAPVTELSKYVSKTIVKETLTVNNQKTIITKSEIDLSRVRIQLEMNHLKSDKYDFTFQNSFGDRLSFGIDNIKKQYYLNRQNSGKVTFSDKFANTISKAPIKNPSNMLKIEVLVDKTSIEVFYNDGETIMTEIFFPNESFEAFSINTTDAALILENIKIEEFQLN